MGVIDSEEGVGNDYHYREDMVGTRSWKVRSGSCLDGTGVRSWLRFCNLYIPISVDPPLRVLLSCFCAVFISNAEWRFTIT